MASNVEFSLRQWDPGGHMSKGWEKDQERKNAVQWLGKELARRAKSRCEVCEASGVPLSIYEVPPVPKEPSGERSLFLCATCHSALSNPKQALKDAE
ncbi:MAG: hypothetical protein AAF191_18480, partial [Verrucomicrobiota bacterium]